MTTFDNLSKTQRTRAALYRDVKSICTETCHFLGLDVTKPAMEIVAELVYKKISVYGTDLEAFAKHAKRSTINDQDVKLLARRNPSLKSRLDAIAPDSAKKDKRRKTVVPVTRVPETPTAKTVSEKPSTSKTETDKEVNEPMDLDNAIDLTFED
ncbi:hypothetical protein O3G_MSEX001390 [Manduca sexta]|uniref:Centromere protein S n=1 Tax=Manduca sexta TaxID=7130 RepID=A0A921YJX1_MANSE|nr:hypothetical protein O3G_MSEX001390 [Manduca sexta]